jgi:enoyl-CoA hydratase
MNDEESAPVINEIIGAIAVVRLNQPAQRNPLSVDTLKNLKRTTSALFSRTDIHSVIFTGTDDSFASGANIRELAQLDSEAALRFSKFGQELFQTIADSEKLTIAAINGYCIGGGLDFALACDIRVASKTATFSHPGGRLGIITGWGGTQKLPRLIGRSTAIELFITGRRFSSTTALSTGLITRVSDPILTCALEIARASKAATPPYQ